MLSVGSQMDQTIRRAMKRFDETVAVALDAALESDTNQCGVVRFDLGPNVTLDWFYAVLVDLEGGPQVFRSHRLEDMPQSVRIVLADKIAEARPTL